MRTRLPIVWSSRCSVNFAAFATFVSFSTAILRHTGGRDFSGLKLSSSRMPAADSQPGSPQFTFSDANSALLHALRHHEALISVWRVRHGARRRKSRGRRLRC